MRLTVTFLLVLSFVGVWAQKPSQMLMMNGRIYNIQVKKLDPPNVEFSLGKNKKTYRSNGQKIFSITDSTGRKTFIYYQDSLVGREFTVPQAQNYVLGMSDGRRYRYGGDFAIGVVSGLGGAAVNIYYGWGVPLLVTSLNGMRKVKIKPRLVYHPELSYDKYYTAGITRKVRNRRLVSTLLGGATGMALGTLFFLIRGGF